MEAMVVLVIVIALFALDGLALRFGVDSRVDADKVRDWS